MSDPYLGEIRLFTYTRGAPDGWQLCDGSLLPISTYDALYTLLGTTYGGDGQSTFGVPDLRGSVPVHQGNPPGRSGYVLGQIGGTETVTLTQAQMGGHQHMLVVLEKTATATTPSGNMLAQPADDDGIYTATISGAVAGVLNAADIGVAGSSNPHENCMPTLAITPCIATAGLWPSQN